MPIRSHLQPVRSGWTPVPDEPPFYPDDLPTEWRLIYFANELTGVLVPRAEWVGANPAVLGQWRQDVPVRFRLYLELGDAERDVGLDLVRERLGNRLGGWVVGPDRAGDETPPETCFVRVESLTAAAVSGARALACPAPTEVIGDPVAERQWLERLAGVAGGRPTLVLMGTAPFAVVRRWQTLVELLGFA
jgi:hypothetical protein